MNDHKHRLVFSSSFQDFFGFWYYRFTCRDCGTRVTGAITNFWGEGSEQR